MSSQSKTLVAVQIPRDIKLLPPLTPGTTNTFSKAIQVETNMYPVTLNESLLNDVYQYSISFSEEVLSSHVKRKVFYAAAVLASTPFLEFMAFDGENIAYSFRKIPDQTIDITARMADLISTKQLYDEFGAIVTSPQNQPQVTLKLVKHYQLGDALSQIKTAAPTNAADANSDTIRARSELAAFITMSLSTLMRHSSIVFALHGERNRIRRKINAVDAHWKSPEGLAVRILLSVEGFISRNGAVFRLDQFFGQPAAKINDYAMGKGIYAVPAGFSALRFLQRGILFNVAAIVLPTYQIGRKVTEILAEIAEGDLKTASPNVYKALFKYRVVTNHLPVGKNSRIGLQTLGPKLQDCPSFRDKNGAKTTIQAYFKQQYGINLNPEYYTYTTIKHFQDRTGADGKVVKAHDQTLYYPIEVLTLYSANNNSAKDLDPIQTKNMLNLMTRRPHVSLQAANDQLKSLQTAITYHQQQTPGSAADGVKSIYHGIQISPQPITASARVLPPPSAQFANQVVPAAAGEFKPKPDWKFVSPASTSIPKIKVVVANLSFKLSKNQPIIDAYADKVIEVAKQKGLAMDMGSEPVYTSTRFDGKAAKDLEQWARQLNSKGAQQKVTYLVIAVCDANSEFYNTLKRVGDSELGLVTQCADSAKIQKTFCSFKGQPPNPSSVASYVTNIILKINSKLGGLNYRLKPTKDADNPLLTRATPKIHPTISEAAPLAIFGIDIFHNPGKRSHAGIVGSWDKSCSQYNGVLIQQPKAKAGKAQSAQEVIDSSTIQSAFVELFFQYAKKQTTPSLPQQIVVYRDGLSESQIASSMDSEIPGIIAASQQAYLTLFPQSPHKYLPTITYLIAVKRHQTFFKPEQGEDDPCGRNRTENVRAGTVIDRDVVRSDLTEFYLQAHASALGTGKCTLYQVVYCSAPNTAKLDDIQLLTNYLSYGHQRAFKSTRIPTPVYFADLLCYRGRCYAQPTSPDGSWAVEGMPSALTARHFWL